MDKLDNFVELRDVKRSYHSGKVVVSALNDVSISINAGELIAITGTSGSGKSTLLQLIGLLDRPSSGEVLFNNQLTSKLSDNQLSSLRNQTIGFVFQSFYLQPNLTVLDNIMLPAMFGKFNRESAHQRAVKIAEAIGARRSDIRRVYLIYATILALIIGLIAIGLSLVVLLIVNNYFSGAITAALQSTLSLAGRNITFSFLTISGQTACARALILLLVVAACWLSSIIPIIRNTLRQPIDDLHSQ